jgi:hypothetical protein
VNYKSKGLVGVLVKTQCQDIPEPTICTHVSLGRVADFEQMIRELGMEFAFEIAARSSSGTQLADRVGISPPAERHLGPRTVTAALSGRSKKEK